MFFYFSNDWPSKYFDYNFDYNCYVFIYMEIFKKIINNNSLIIARNSDELVNLLMRVIL